MKIVPPMKWYRTAFSILVMVLLSSALAGYLHGVTAVAIQIVVEHPQVVDMVTDGVSLVSNYRSQFRRIIHQSSYADLVRRLRNKVAEVRQTG